MVVDLRFLVADFLDSIEGIERRDSYDGDDWGELIQDIQEFQDRGSLKPIRVEVERTCEHCDGFGIIAEMEDRYATEEYVQAIGKLVQAMREGRISARELEAEIEAQSTKAAAEKPFRDDPSLVRNYWVNSLHKTMEVP